jgi:hypothetical protein
LHSYLVRVSHASHAVIFSCRHLQVPSNNYYHQKQRKPIIFAADENPCPYAQLATNVDNFHTAFPPLKSTHPNAKITDEVQTLIENLYPPCIPCIPPTPSPHGTPSHENIPQLPIHNCTLFQALCKVK